MTNQKIISILGVIKKPNDTFREISENSKYYFISAVCILVLSYVFYPTLSNPEKFSDHPPNVGYYILDAQIQIIDSIHSVASAFLLMIIIFYLGRKLGGSNNFRSVFSVVSYASVPALIGGIVFFIFTIYTAPLESISGIDSNDSRWWNLFWIMYAVILVPCSLWSFILSLKALKIVNNFSTKKALGTYFLASLINFGILYPISYFKII